MPENITQKDIKQYITWGLLLLCCVLLIAMLLNLHKNQNENDQSGRYCLFIERVDDIFFYHIMDTKTGQLWQRIDTENIKGVLYLGTVNQPCKSLIARIPKYPVVNTLKLFSVYGQPLPEPVAIVDGSTVGKGDKVWDATVVKIQKDGVEFERNGDRWKQAVGESSDRFSVYWTASKGEFADILKEYNISPPPNTQQAKPQAYIFDQVAKEQKASALDTNGIVTGILLNEESPLTVIDGEVFREGQSIRNVKVVKINQDSVEFETDGIRWSQKVNEQPSSFWP